MSGRPRSTKEGLAGGSARLDLGACSRVCLNDLEALACQQCAQNIADGRLILDYQMLCVDSVTPRDTNVGVVMKA